MAEALSPEAARAEVTSYTGQSLTVDQIKSLRKILAVPRDDSAIHSHLRKHGHPLGALPSETKWWLKVHKAMTEAGLYHDQPTGTHSKPADNQRKAVIAWLELRILPALEGEPVPCQNSRLALSWCFLRSSGCPPVLADQAVDGLSALDPGGHVDRLAGLVQRRSLLPRLMGPMHVVVPRVLAQDLQEVAFTVDQQVVEALAP